MSVAEGVNLIGDTFARPPIRFARRLPLLSEGGGLIECDLSQPVTR